MISRTLTTHPPTSFFDPSSTASFTPLSDFLDFTRDQGISAAIVLPTWRYFDKESPETGYLSETAETEIQEFVSDLLTGVYGDAEISAFEIGNEWFNERQLYDAQTNPDGWTAAEFGTLQGRIAAIVNAAIETVDPDLVPEIWIQTGQDGDQDLDDNGVHDNRLQRLEDRS